MVVRVVNFTVSQNSTERLDKVLVQNIPELSRVRLQGLIKNEYVNLVIEVKYYMIFIII